MNQYYKKTILFSLLFMAAILCIAFTEPVSAIDNTGNSEHSKRATFEKNYCLSVDQKDESYPLVMICPFADGAYERQLAEYKGR